MGARRCFAITTLSLLLFGCNYTANVRPDLTGIDVVLEPGVSTKAEVEQVLGKPNGEGRFFLPIDTESREVWSYYHEKGSLEALPGGEIDADMRRVFLFVYFDDDRFDGYMWFSSLREHSP